MIGLGFGLGLGGGGGGHLAQQILPLFNDPNDALFMFYDASNSFSDLAGTTLVTPNSPIARANSLVNNIVSTQATLGARGLWKIDSQGGYYFPDQSDDLFSFTLPSTSTGTHFIIARNGCYFESRGTISTLLLGASGSSIKNGTRGCWDLLKLLDKVIAIGFKNSSLNTQQRQQITDAFKVYGAGGLISFGPEILSDSDFTTGIPWSYNGGWVYDAGNQRADRPVGSAGNGSLRQNPGGLVAGSWYRIGADITISGSGGNRLRLYNGASGSVALLPVFTDGVNGNFNGIVQAIPGDNGAGVFAVDLVGMTVDNLSLKLVNIV